MNKYKIIPGVGIIGTENNYYIRTVSSNFKLPNNPKILEEIRTTLQNIAKGEKINASSFIIQYLLSIKAITNNQNDTLNPYIYFSNYTILGEKLNEKLVKEQQV